MAEIIEKYLTWASKWLMYLTALSLLAMMLHVFADVALKYVINQPIPGTAEIVAHYYMVAAVFMPMPFVEIRNSGISVDMIYNLLGAKLRRVLLLLAYVGQIVFFSILAYQSALDAWKAFQIKEFISSQIVVYVWPATFILPVGLFFAALVSLLRLFQIMTRSDWESITNFDTEAEPDHPVKETL